MSNNSGNNPKSFKNMAFPPPRSGTPSVYAPLPPSPTPKTISISESERRAQQLKEVKKFINDQRCLICKAQLDGSVGYDRATVYCCVNGEDECRIVYRVVSENPLLIIVYWSSSVYNTTYFGYEIESTHEVDGLYKNSIYKLDLSLNSIFQKRNKKELLTFEGERLQVDASLSEERFLERIRLYTLFS